MESALDFPDILHIPVGINFECSNCGNCCLHWPVPATQADFDRLHDLSVRALLEESTAADKEQLELADLLPGTQFNEPFKEPSSESFNRLFKRLAGKNATDKLSQFPYTLEKKADGRCIFLREDQRCQLHATFGPQAKPAMCQLFPYTFTLAPDGFYAALSFASTGVLLNYGAALSEQRDFLITRLALFKSLFPNLYLDWSKIQICDGQSLRWSEYISIEQSLIEHFHPLNQSSGDICPSLVAASRSLCQIQTVDGHLDRDHLVEATPELVDLLLVKHLLEFYFPQDLSAPPEETLDARELLEKMIKPPSVVRYRIQDQDLRLSDICKLSLGRLNNECENLLKRFVYSRIFGKLYFGPGLANLSVIAGFHHLGLLISLLRIKLKCAFYDQSKVNGETVRGPIEFTELAELVRALERRLTTARYTKEAVATLHVLLESPSRFERIIGLAG